MAKTQPFRIDKTLLRSLNIEKHRLGGFDSVSDLIVWHRSKSRKFDKFNRVFSDWVKNNPKATLGEFYSHLVTSKIVGSI